MKLLVSPEGNFLRFRPMRVDVKTGKAVEGPKNVCIRSTVVATFAESHFPGLLVVELDSRACPSEDDGEPVIYFVRCKESEFRGALGLKVYGQVEGVTA